jgi:hypothetical protein
VEVGGSRSVSFVVYLRTKFSICFDHCLPFPPGM